MDNATVTPETLYNELSKTVVGQEEYLKSLCNAAWLHSLRYEHYKQTGEVLDKPKQNIPLHWPVWHRQDACRGAARWAVKPARNH